MIIKPSQKNDPIEAAVAKGIGIHGLIEPGDALLVAVSGGPDSVALLCILAGLGRKVTIAHLNHGLRGRESQGDARFVKKLGANLGIPVQCGKADVSGLARRRKQSLETAGREARRGYLLSTAKRLGCTKIATGHTRDDQAETVLMHLLRGCGLTGLAGIPRINGPFIRPLLDLSREDIMGYLDRHRLEFRQDSSNRSPVHTRNRIRHQLIPRLESYNPRIKQALANLGEQAAADLEVLRRAGLEAFGECAAVDKAKIAIDLSLFPRYNKGLQRFVIRECAERLCGPGTVPSFERVETAIGLIHSGKVGGWLRLAPSLWAAKGYRMVLFSSEKPKEPREPAVSDRTAERRLKIPGNLRLEGHVIRAGFVTRDRMAFTPGERTVYFDWERLRSKNVRLGCWKPGEAMTVFNRTGKAAIKDLFIEAKVPRPARDRWPLVRSGAEAIWLCGVRRSSAAPVTADTKTILRLEWTTDEA